MSTSDELKNYLTQNFGGAEADWKRLSKGKNDQGQPVRVFENKRGGEKVEVTETGAGQFSARSLSDAAKEVFIKQEDKSLYAHAVETDAEKIALAKKLIKMIVSPKYDEEEDDFIMPSDEDIATAGAALANQFVFSICVDDMGTEKEGKQPYAITLTPHSYFKKNGYAYDQHVSMESLLPEGAEEVMESSFAFCRADGVSVYHDLRQLMNDMLAKGFVYDPSYQKFMDRAADEKLADKISQTMQDSASAARPSAPKP